MHSREHLNARCSTSTAATSATSAKPAARPTAVSAAPGHSDRWCLFKFGCLFKSCEKRG